MRIIRWWHGWSQCRPNLAALGLGALSALALPPLFVLPTLLIALPGLLALTEGQSFRRAFRLGVAFAIGHHLLGLYWITEAILFEVARFWWLLPLAVPALSVVLSPFIALPVAVAARLPSGLARVLVLAGGWTLAGIAQQFVATGVPWNPLGSVWAIPGAVGDVALQPAALFSVHGLTLLTVLLASLPSLGSSAWAAGAALLTLWLSWGADRLAEPAAPASGLIAVLVQGNVVQGQKANRAAYLENFNRHLKLTETGVAEAMGKPTLVIWPETASPFLIDRDAAARAAVAEAAQGPAMVGSIRIDADGQPRNSLMAVYGPGPVAGLYDKWHLVPFGEYVPDWLPLPVKILPGQGLAKGSGPETISFGGLPPAGLLICYEAIFPGQVVDEANRPDMLVNITNDSWFGNSTGPRQHLAAVRLRAVEEGLPLMRAANTGITAGFDAHGRELGRLNMGEQGVLLVPVPGPLPPTLFARLGLWWPTGLALLTLLAGWGLARKGRY